MQNLTKDPQFVVRAQTFMHIGSNDICYRSNAYDFITNQLFQQLKQTKTQSQVNILGCYSPLTATHESNQGKIGSSVKNVGAMKFLKNQLEADDLAKHFIVEDKFHGIFSRLAISSTLLNLDFKCYLLLKGSKRTTPTLRAKNYVKRK